MVNSNELFELRKVVKEDVKRVANKYLKPENLRIIVVGKGLDVADKLENIDYNGSLIPVKYFNKVGELIEKPVFAKEIDASVTVKNIFDKHIESIGGAEKLNTVKSISITAAVTIPVAIVRVSLGKCFPTSDTGTPMAVAPKAIPTKTPNAN